MMTLYWTAEALQDREDIYSYIEQDNPSAALALDDLTAEKSSMLLTHPKMGRIGRASNTFELIVHSNYMVVYEILQTQIQILRVVHTSRQRLVFVY